MICSKCGYNNGEIVKNCVKCGFPTGLEKGYNPYPNKRRKPTKVAWVSVAFGALSTQLTLLNLIINGVDDFLDSGFSEAASVFWLLGTISAIAALVRGEERKPCLAGLLLSNFIFIVYMFI